MPASSNIRRERAALALATGRTVAEAAVDAGSSERAVYSWKNEPAFKDRIRQLQADMFAQAVAVLAAGNRKASNTLVQLLDSDTEKVALAAARSVLELGCRLREALDLARRLEEHEQRLALLEGGEGDDGDAEEDAGTPGAAAAPAAGPEGQGPEEGGADEEDRGAGERPDVDAPGNAPAHGTGLS
jgi:hypothetical protein